MIGGRDLDGEMPHHDDDRERGDGQGKCDDDGLSSGHF